MNNHTDKELLMLAAKAAGIDMPRIEICAYSDVNGFTWVRPDKFLGKFSPLTDDGDALRLAVKLDFHVVFHPALAQAIVRPYYCAERDGETIENLESNTDPYAATRRAIVRAAAAIGEKL